MTTKEKLLTLRDLLREERQGFTWYGSTTATETAHNLFTAAGLIGIADDFFSSPMQKELVFLSNGNNYLQRRRIIDFVKATGIGTLEDDMPVVIPTGASIWIGEKGWFSDVELIEFMNEAQEKLSQHLALQELHDFQRPTTLAGTDTGNGYGTRIMPTDSAQRPFSFEVNGVPAVPLQQNEKYRFLNDTFTAVMVLLQSDNTIWYKPVGSNQITFHDVPLPARMTLAGTESDFPSRFDNLVIQYAYGMAMQKKGFADLSVKAMNDFWGEVKFRNEKYSV